MALQWTVIDDFSPGIHTVPGTKHPLGSASDQTWRCVAAQNGALIPGPRSDYAINHGALDGGGTICTEGDNYWVDGFMVNPLPVYGGLGNPYPGPDEDNNELWFGFEWYETGPEKAHLNVSRYRFNYSDPALRWQSISDHSLVATYSNYTRPRRCFFTSSRTIPTGGDVAEAGQPVIAWAFDQVDMLQMFPDPDDAATTSTYDLPNPGAGTNVFRVHGHQGRLIFTPLSLYAQGSGQVGVTTESMYWTEANDHMNLDSDLAGLYYKVIAGAENANGFTDMQSLTADELIMFKAKGGALVFRGDIDDPTIITLPNVMSPGRAMSKGTPSTVGYCYVVRGSGLWVWGGGDSAEYLTPQMTADFWVPDPEEDYTPHWKDTNLCAWNEWVILPNGYLFDTVKGSIWRYARHRFYFHDTSWDHRWMYATKARFNAEDPFMAWRWDKTLGARSFRWTSTYMPKSIDRSVDLREVVVVASGHGTVTVRAITAQGIEEEVLDVDSDIPTVIGRAPFSIQGTHLQIQVDSVGSDSTFDGAEGEEDAPTIYELRLGSTERMKVGR